MRSSKRLLEDVSGRRVPGYRAPSFSITKDSLWALDVLIEEGYEYDTSIFPIRHDRYGIPDAPRHAHVLSRPAGLAQSRCPARRSESPASTCRSPAAAISGCCRTSGRAGASHRVNTAERQPVVFYLHPWEVDPDQPRFQVSTADAPAALHGPEVERCGGSNSLLRAVPVRVGRVGARSAVPRRRRWPRDGDAGALASRRCVAIAVATASEADAARVGRVRRRAS